MLTHFVRMVRAWKRYNQSLSELNRLGDRELADIGISRSDIPRVAWNASPSSKRVRDHVSKAPAPAAGALLSCRSNALLFSEPLCERHDIRRLAVCRGPHIDNPFIPLSRSTITAVLWGN